MKKILVLTVLILGLVGIVASIGTAASTTQSWGLDLSVAGTVSDSAWSTPALDSGLLGLWEVTCNGLTTLTPGSTPATLTGNFGGKVWTYQYWVGVSAPTVADDASSDWKTITNLVNSSTSSANIPVPGTGGGPFVTAVSARYFRMGYNVTLASPLDSASASGSARLSIKAVPEASTLVGFGSALAMAGPGLVGWFRRRRV